MHYFSQQYNNFGKMVSYQFKTRSNWLKTVSDIVVIVAIYLPRPGITCLAYHETIIQQVLFPNDHRELHDT